MLLNPHATLNFIKRRNSGDDNMIPLINIVFLLLIFYMVAGQVSRNLAPEVLPPTTASEAPLATDLDIITLGIDGALALNGVALTLQTLEQELNQKPQTKITVKADGRLTAKALHPLMNLLRTLGHDKVVLYSQLREPTTP